MQDSYVSQYHNEENGQGHDQLGVGEVTYEGTARIINRRSARSAIPTSHLIPSTSARARI